ncbi:hypothetical protein B0H16DRAFT_1465096 [Mycena metata]|uniref:Uncharacterized protein n=1 Tax=Mycena metata TaxID=1033252 RepID=A0AAD7N046_9AGAR|nr:hypothetical protein B0H16DRAFT_1465096 [Mycena metata]
MCYKPFTPIQFKSVGDSGSIWLLCLVYPSLSASSEIQPQAPTSPTSCPEPYYFHVMLKYSGPTPPGMPRPALGYISVCPANPIDGKELLLSRGLRATKFLARRRFGRRRRSKTASIGHKLDIYLEHLGHPSPYNTIEKFLKWVLSSV